MIGTNGKRESGKSVLAVQLDDEDIYIYIYINQDEKIVKINQYMIKILYLKKSTFLSNSVEHSQ